MKTYLIADIDVQDMVQYRNYVAQVPPFVEKHGGKYLVRAGHVDLMDGDWAPKRLIVLEFPTKQQAHNFVNDPAYQEVARIRHQAARTNMVIVGGAS